MKPEPPQIECDKFDTPSRDPVTRSNAPELIVELYGFIETEHKCLDKHREEGVIR